MVTSDFGNKIQGELNLYGVDGKLNSASFRRKLDPISKNAIRKQNSIEFLFKDLKHFDAQNPVIGNLIKEIDIGKKKDLSKILKGALDIIDIELRSRLNRYRDDETFNPDGNNINNNNNLPPPPPPKFFHKILGQINCQNLHHHRQIFLEQQHLQIKFFLHNLLLQLINHLRLMIFQHCCLKF